MSSDVFKKCIDANELINGRSVYGTDKLGNSQKLDRPFNDFVATSGLEVKLDTRFDDPQYYTA